MSHRKTYPELEPEQRLAMAVIRQGIQDAKSGRQQAIAFLRVSNYMFRFWCAVLGAPEELIMEEWVEAA